MGDRANVILKSGDEQVCLYTHWCGHELPQIVKNGLIRGKSRWHDFQYLTRIIFCEMIKDDVLGKTGFGISQKKHDGRKVLKIDCDNTTMSVNGDEPISLASYVNIDEPGWGS